MTPELLHTAILGTSRRPFDRKLVDPETALLLEAFPDADDESQLLRAAYCSILCHNAGTAPLAYAHVLPEKSVCETSAYAPESLDNLLSNILQVGAPERNHLLPQCFAIYLSQNCIVHPKYSLRLLKISNELPETLLQTTMLILGERAKSILHHFKAYEAIKYSETDIWQFGTIQKRKNYFEKLLVSNRLAAMELLDEAFTKEPVSFQRYIVEILLKNYVPEDRKKLEWLLEFRFAYRPKEKAIEKSLRYLLSAKLLSDSKSQLYEVATVHLARYFAQQEIQLPTTDTASQRFMVPNSEDEFWNAPFMESNFGFETQHYDIALYKNIVQFWLAEFIRFLPVSFWCTHLKLNLFDTLVYFTRNEAFIVRLEGKMTAIYYQNFLENASFSKNLQLARLLIEHDKKNETGPLLDLLPPPEFEQYVQKNDFFLREDLMKYGKFNQLIADWSEAFSCAMIQKSYTCIVIERRYLPSKIQGLLLIYCNAKAQNALEYFYQLGNPSAYHLELWKNLVYQPLMHLLLLKKNLESYNNQS